MTVYALSTHGVNDTIFRIADVLEVPVLIAALLALAAVLFELGSFAIEVRERGRRSTADLEALAARSRTALLAGDRDGARRALLSGTRSAAMADGVAVIARVAQQPGGDHRLNKALADFDFESQKRLARTRLLVRIGPALGLMGTLIPLSPALTGLAKGNVDRLTENLRVAFSVTVLGLLVGAVAFGISLYRDRMYGQDYSDLEYMAAVVSDEREEVRS